ncbi:asparagine N-glycosylation enzyme membrane subunit Stt3 [Deinococcus metalli]|uniref:Asparagine N-glycosylation enzyme membrane subunit Stt3 n=1 Tax=Deinococcus metalli TaxID=1141878 RepID=A0A7W8NQL4_9DEIO|nr:hypothetical protein [Deinococcus metalli]MBB5379189.1 asparagine N-glycosylation enzyme membrane subunit Stt3 [Deinococcus metalli]GHF65248.1 hypothetical protein GCM10017781_46230 [Deinococcus metalli]
MVIMRWLLVPIAALFGFLVTYGVVRFLGTLLNNLTPFGGPGAPAWYITAFANFATGMAGVYLAALAAPRARQITAYVTAGCYITAIVLLSAIGLGQHYHIPWLAFLLGIVGAVYATYNVQEVAPEPITPTGALSTLHHSDS